MHTKFLSALLLFGLLAVFTSAASAAQPAGQIQSARVRGEAYAIDKVSNARTDLGEGTKISQGSIITTGKGSSVVLIFSNGAMLSLGNDSVLDIETFTQDPFKTAFDASTVKAEPSASTTKLNLTKGELVSRVAKLNTRGGSTFTVSTPVGAAGIRGTVFRIVYRPDGAGHATFSLVTLEGRVLVTLAKGVVNAPPVEVTAGKEVAVTAEVKVDASGAVTVVLPSGASVPVATTATSGSTAAVAAEADTIAQAVINVVVPSSPPAPTPVTPPPAPTTPVQPVNTSIVSPSS